MGPNLLLAFLCLLLAISPYISQVQAVNDYLQLGTVGNIRGSFQIFVVTVGIGGLLFALFNMFLGKKNGSPYLALGALVLVVGFFNNAEQIPLPLRNVLFGGELFFAFVVSFALAVTGFVVEWLVHQSN